jgi:hypothetical protein
VDPWTPIIIQPTEWGRIPALGHLEALKGEEWWDDRVIVSVHFYEPQVLTNRRKNAGRFSYPGPVPRYPNAARPETVDVNDAYITGMLEEARDWAGRVGVRLCVGEFGCARDVAGAGAYLAAVVGACRQLGIPHFAYAFREKVWNVMNYELGPSLENHQPLPRRSNPLIQAILPKYVWDSVYP